MYSAEELEQIRRNLMVIVNQLGSDLDIPDPERLSDVLDGVNGLLQYVDDYPQPE